jgi:flagellin
LREARILERLATGLRITRASEAPAGLVLVESLRSQLVTINQAIENTQRGVNLVQTAEGGLGQMSNLLVRMRGLAVEAMNTGVVGPQQRAALQDAMDQTLQAVNRIAETTRFGDQSLLNGSLGFVITNISPELTDVRVQSANVQFPVTINVEVIAPATRAQLEGTIAPVQSAAVTIRVTGPLGSEDINIPAGATQAQVEEAINAVREFTGVEAEGGVIRSVEYGSAAFVQLEEVEGDLEGITPGRATGTDIQATVSNATASGQANVITVSTPMLSAQITVQQEQTGTFSFTIEGGGARFQLNTAAEPTDQITLGIGSVTVSNLGTTSGIGNLASLTSGGANSLLTNPGNAVRIIDAAIREVSTLRGQLGSVQSRLFESNINALRVEFENLSASRSQIADTNFAEEITALIRERILRQTGLTVLRQSNLSQGLVTRLLG